MAIISRLKEFGKLFANSLLIRIVLAILAVTVILLLVQTVTPVNITENMIFSYQKTMLMGEAETIASSLSSAVKLSSEGVEDVMNVLGRFDIGQIIVTDAEGTVLYSTVPGEAPPGRTALYPEIISALKGNDAFRCHYTEHAFESFGAMPIMSAQTVTGCVFLADVDSEQAVLLESIQENAIQMGAVIILVCVLLYLLFGSIVIKKNTGLLTSIRRVREGDYEYRIDAKGKDEFSQLASEFNLLTNRLQETEQRRRQFVSDASHELRTPLAAMRLLSDSILQNDMDQDTVREFVQDISGEADRLTRMTTKLLGLTALDSRQFASEETEPVNLSQCCKKAVRLLGPYAQEKGAQVEESTEENCCVLAREDEIFQLVLNLAENGIKYSQEGGMVRLIAYSQGDKAILIVEDNGVGIPEEELERIFQRFYRVDKARSREAGGTGLGLAIVRETAEKFGGTVTAANRPQGGARFTAQFPLLKWEGEP